VLSLQVRRTGIEFVILIAQSVSVFIVLNIRLLIVNNRLIVVRAGAFPLILRKSELNRDLSLHCMLI
jgi:hypothetical protein